LIAVTLFVLGCLAQDPVARLGKNIEDGKVQVRFDAAQGYLPWLLEALDVPPESQMLVFSKTSIQKIVIRPENPRKLYFNDSVAIGALRGGTIELAAQDPERGLIFYLLDQSSAHHEFWSSRPERVSPFSRRADCAANCHFSKAGGLPQMLVRSVVTDRHGQPLKQSPALDTDDRTPISQLWGGWFVTGSGSIPHMGNSARDERGEPIQLSPPGSSDIAALLVFQHQMRMMNLIARAKAAPSAETVDELTDALLFTGEAPLPGKISSASGFARKFAARGPLREFDLNTRLMRYGCSYMIYSDAFQALPASVKTVVYRRIRTRLDAPTLEILRGLF
jgi:hypothetical protein